MLIWILLAIIAVPFLLLVAQVDNWQRDLSQNRAETSTTASDPRLRPLHIRQPLPVVQNAVDSAIATLSKWESSGTWENGTLKLTRTTPWLGFVDDIRIRLNQEDDAVVVNATSQSRFGKGDLGQNPRNIDELFQAIRRQMDR